MQHQILLFTHTHTHTCPTHRSEVPMSANNKTWMHILYRRFGIIWKYAVWGDYIGTTEFSTEYLRFCLYIYILYTHQWLCGNGITQPASIRMSKKCICCENKNDLCVCLARANPVIIYVFLSFRYLNVFFFFYSS